MSTLIVLQATQQFKLDEKKLDASGVLSSKPMLLILPKFVRVRLPDSLSTTFFQAEAHHWWCVCHVAVWEVTKSDPLRPVRWSMGLAAIQNKITGGVSQVTPWKFWLSSLKLASLLRCEGDDFCQKLPQFPWKTGTGLGCITVSRGSCNCKGLQPINYKDFSTNKRKLIISKYIKM